MAIPCTAEAMRAALPSIMSAIPAPWRGTTFNNSNLLTREGFAAAMGKLVTAKAGAAITEAELYALGNAEDYLRVSSNISATLEIVLALDKGYEVSRVFTFASAAMPIVAVALTAKAPVHVYAGGVSTFPFTAAHAEMLQIMGGNVILHAEGAPATKPADGGVVVALVPDTSAPGAAADSCVDATVAPNVLFIAHPEVVDPVRVLVIRKRMSTPLTTPVAEVMLRRLGGLEATDPAPPSDAERAEFLAHLQTLAGTTADPAFAPHVFTAGLPSLATLWVTLARRGGADLLMCSTAYGGSNQLTDVLCAASPQRLRKHTFDIQGDAVILDAIRGELDRLAAMGDALLPTTVLFVEVPTNPDMKVPDTEALAAMLSSYHTKTGKDIVLLVDTTFAPHSKVMAKNEALNPDLTVVAFISLSKSVSRGMTTAGALVVNHTEVARALHADIGKTQALLDTTATPDQMRLLCENHRGVEERCQKAYEVCVQAGDNLVASVAKHAGGHQMKLAFVSRENAAHGFTSSTFSFNLPVPSGASAGDAAALAQRFVDLLCAHKNEFKPCVSFGQDNGLVYATVPATSTQGVISEADKAKQAVGGVQLVRLSFAPTCDVAKVSALMDAAVAKVYGK